MGDAKNNSLATQKVSSVLRVGTGARALRLGTACQVQGAGKGGEPAMKAKSTITCTT